MNEASLNYTSKMYPISIKVRIIKFVYKIFIKSDSLININKKCDHVSFEILN